MIMDYAIPLKQWTQTKMNGKDNYMKMVQVKRLFVIPN